MAWLRGASGRGGSAFMRRIVSKTQSNIKPIGAHMALFTWALVWWYLPCAAYFCHEHTGTQIARKSRVDVTRRTVGHSNRGMVTPHAWSAAVIISHLDVFLGVVPRAPHVVQEKRHHDAGNCAKHEISCQNLFGWP